MHSREGGGEVKVIFSGGKRSVVYIYGDIRKAAMAVFGGR